MKKTFLIIFILVLSGISVMSYTGNYYYKINKSFDIFAEIIRELSENYVLEVDPEILIENGIEGMLSTLDPYTVYYNESDQEDIDLLTNSRYTGFGFSVRNIDSLLTITDLREGYSAQKEGMSIGDVIYKIDGIEVIKRKSSNLRELTQGEKGSTALFELIKPTGDTVELELTRAEIELKSLSYSELISDSLLYIKLDRFSRTSAIEVRSTIYENNRDSAITGIILDLRNNPGGLLDASIALTELFVPKGSLIVSTKGKDSTIKNNYYRSVLKPLLPDTPIIVIINGRSASASEIFAGAIQDLDRGVVVGNRSFGKGLVQSVYELPYNTGIKITTSKYYTPSGRSIQKLKFADEYQKRVEEDKDTTTFYTKNGREVYELSGISPDIIIKSDTLTDIVYWLERNNHIFKFVTQYLTQKNYTEDEDNLFEAFMNYIDSNSIVYESESYKEILQFKELVSNNGTNFENELNTIISSLEKRNKEEFIIQKDNILKWIKNEINRRILNDNEFVEYNLLEDPYLEKSLEILNSDQYTNILEK